MLSFSISKMAPRLRIDETLSFGSINQPMLLVVALRPLSGEFSTERFRFAGASERIPPGLFDKP